MYALYSHRLTKPHTYKQADLEPCWSILSKRGAGKKKEVNDYLHRSMSYVWNDDPP